VKFNAGYATAHQWYAEALLLLGRTDEARAEIDQAMELDPLSPASMNVRAYLLLVTGAADDAIEVYRNMGQLYPNYSLGRTTALLAFLHAGRWDDARTTVDATAAPAELKTAMKTVIDGIESPSRKAAGVRAAGTLDRMLPASLAALWYAALHDDDAALERLERTYSDRADANFPLILVHPLLEGLHGTDRYTRIADGMGIAIPGTTARR
jgi:tetratricopeptide (TPR) repeat protein